MLGTVPDTHRSELHEAQVLSKSSFEKTMEKGAHLPVSIKTSNSAPPSVMLHEYSVSPELDTDVLPLPYDPFISTARLPNRCGCDRERPTMGKVSAWAGEAVMSASTAVGRL